MKYAQLTIDQRSLYDQLCCKYALEQGFKAVKKNKGAPGIDEESIEAFESSLDEELSKLSSELKSWTYKPMPVRRVEIPKPGKNSGVRLLGVPYKRRGLSFCRFADDCQIIVRSLKSAKRIMGSISRFIENKIKFRPQRGPVLK